jgi:polysaccharide biosynthesis/export protein
MRVLCVFATLLYSFSIWAQTPSRPNQPSQAAPPPRSVPQELNSSGPSTTPTSLAGQEYRIGRDDLIEVNVFEVPELGSITRVGASGKISLPLLGSIDAANHTPIELERLIEEALKRNYINDPHVTVLVREYASQPVSVIGAVKAPGIYQLKGQKYLFDMLAMAQGLDQANAGKTIQILRRQSEGTDGTDEPQTIAITTEELFQSGKTELNIPIQAGDIINVSQAGSVFVIGEVTRPGEYVLRQGKDITAAQALALGGGFSKEAKKQQCLIIRIHRDGSKEEIPVNVAKILDGSLRDVPMMPNDILFVPANKVKTGLLRGLDTTIAILSARAAYRY